MEKHICRNVEVSIDVDVENQAFCGFCTHLHKYQTEHEGFCNLYHEKLPKVIYRSITKSVRCCECNTEFLKS